MNTTSSSSSTPLEEARHETFAQGLARGLTGAEAYRRAGYEAGKNSYAPASRLGAKPHIVARVKEIRKETAAASVLTRNRALEILAAIAETAPRNADRIAACRLAGTWCGWDTEPEPEADEDTVAAQAQAETIAAGLRDLIFRSRAKGYLAEGPDCGRDLKDQSDRKDHREAVARAG